MTTEINFEQRTRWFYGLALLAFSLVAGIVLFYAVLIRSFGLCYSGGATNLQCATTPFLLIIFFLLNIGVLFFSLFQIVKPLFKKKVFVHIVILYGVFAVGIFTFDLFAKQIQSTELSCLVMSYYNNNLTEQCYYSLALTKKDASFCAMSGTGERVSSCKEVVAHYLNDVTLCGENKKCIQEIENRGLEIDIEKTFENLEIKIEAINNEIRKNTKGEKIAKIKITSKKYDGWISYIGFEGSSNMISLMTLGSVKLYDEYGKLVSFGDYDNTGYLGIDIKPNTTKYLTVVADTGDVNGVVSLGLAPIVSIYNPDNSAYANFNKFNLKPNNFVGIPEGYAQQPIYLRSKIELKVR